MPNYCSPKLEFSIDPLNDTTPAWTDVTTYLVDADWNSGKDSDLGDPQAGQAVFVLKNTNRDWEPEYASGRFYPNIVPLRRFRWSITADGVSRPQGTWYATSYQLQYDAQTTTSRVIVSCTDLLGLLSLQTLPLLDPPDAEDYTSVVDFDQPFAYYILNDQFGKTMQAVTGTEGRYHGNPGFSVASPVLGSGDKGVLFPSGGNTYAHVNLTSNELTILQDAGEFSVEAVIDDQTPATNRTITAWGFTGASVYQVRLTNEQASIRAGGVTTSTVGDIAASGSHHVCATWDGFTLRYYRDGVLLQTAFNQSVLDASVASESLYIGAGGPHESVTPTASMTVSNVAYYDYALKPARVAAHAAAATSRGYAQATAGTRIAALATNALWSTAGIPAGQITVTPRMQVGQSVLDEIVQTVKAETPIGMFYADDNGNPAYQAWDYDSTIDATLGDRTSETQYDDLDTVYDDELYNQSTVSREGGLAQTATDLTSVGQYLVRAHDETGLILSLDSDAALLAQAFIDRFSNPMKRLATIDLNGAAQNTRTQILVRDVGDVIRVKRRGAGGTTAVDVVTRILGKQKHLDVSRHLTCTWRLARGFDGSSTTWHLGVPGYSELGQTTVLA